ncbi:MAG: ATP-binding protein, partial [Myxococcota bacterium]
GGAGLRSRPMSARGRRPLASIPTRVFGAFLLVLLAFGGVAVTSVVQHDRTAGRLRLLHEGYLPLALRLSEARTTQSLFRQQLAQGPEARNWMQAARQVRPSTLRRVEVHLERAERLAERIGDPETLPPVRAAFDRVRTAQTALTPRYDEAFATLEAGDEARASRMLAALEPEELAIGRLYRDGYNQLQERIETLSAASAERERQASIVLGVLFAMALLLGVAMTAWARALLEPLPGLQARVAAVAEGDLSARATGSRRDDEIGRLTRDFERMVEALAARSERLRALRRIQEQIVSGLGAGVVVVDADGRVQTANPAAERVLGLGGAEGRALAETAAGQALPELGALVARVRREAEPARRDGLRHAGRDLELYATPFGEGEGVLLVADDVTEANRTKRRLIQTERLAAIGRMAAHVTHEVRNPLSSIGLNVELLGDEIALPGGDADEARALLGAIQREIERLRGITEEYLRLARVPQPHLEADDLGELVRDIGRFVAPEMERAGVRFEVHVEGTPAVAFDEGQLRQALLNLLRNAREALGEGGRVSLGLAPAEGGVALEVEDDGPGIDPAMRERIFELFETTKERGTGLGLPLTQQIVSAHGGTIRCVPGEGGGTRFEIRLPLAERAAAE